MEAILFLIVVAFLIYAMAINPRHISTIIGTRLSTGDQIQGSYDFQKILEILQTASWIRDKKEIRAGEADAGEDSDLIEVVCKSVTYQIRISPSDDNTSKLGSSVECVGSKN